MYSLFHTVRQIFAEKEVIYGSGLKQIAVGVVVELWEDKAPAGDALLVNYVTD